MIENKENFLEIEPAIFNPDNVVYMKCDGSLSAPVEVGTEGYYACDLPYLRQYVEKAYINKYGKLTKIWPYKDCTFQIDYFISYPLFYPVKKPKK